MKTGKFNESRVVFILALVFGFSYMNRLAINYLLPVIEGELNISGSDIGLILLASTIALGVSALIIGYISDKQGKRKKFLTMAVITIGIGSILSIFADSFNSLLLSRVVVGLGFGPIMAALFSITEKASSENKFGTNTGFIMAGGEAMATILAPFLLTQLAVMFNWQMAFAIIGVPTILVGIAVAKFVPDVSGKIEDDEDSEEIDVHPIEMFKYPNMIACSILCIFAFGGFFSLLIYGPLYFEVTMKLDLATIGMLASAMGIFSFCYTFIVPRSTDKYGRKPVLTLACLVCAIAPFAMYLFPSSYIAMGAFAVLGGLGGSVIIFFNTIVPIEGLPDSLKASGSAFLLAVSEIVGAGVMVYVAGIVADTYGYPSLMLFSGVLFLASFGLCFFLKESNMAFASQEPIEEFEAEESVDEELILQ